MADKNFIIILGGPGKFVGCDKAHDQTWTNYLVPIQLAAAKNLYNKDIDEIVHWFVYEPAYKNRWADDSEITKKEKKQSDGYWLHTNRKSKTENIIAKGAKNYLHRIQQIANDYKIKYHAIGKPSDIWTKINAMKDGSITRIWYSGHAAGSGLMLTLEHTTTGSCTPFSSTSDMVLLTDIANYKHLKVKFSKSTKYISKFYGCYTSDFAKKWNETFSVKSEGAELKIDFGSIDRPSSISNILERIEKTPTSKGPTGWKKYHTLKPLTPAKPTPSPGP